jgi:toxin secretion/phage lysis holin
MTKTFDKFMYCITTGAVMTFINLVFGKIDYSFGFLMLVMLLDYITGLMCGWLDKSISSDKATRGLFKKLFVFIYVIIAHHLDVMLDKDYVRVMVCYAYAAGEVISIIENGTKLGVPVPEPIKKALELLNTKED